MKITNCNTCPFNYRDFDPDSMGYDTCDICVLAIYNGQSQCTIRCYDTYSSADDLEEEKIREDFVPLQSVPDWCPLRNGGLTVEL